jgi:hypothetical protein
MPVCRVKMTSPFGPVSLGGGENHGFVAALGRCSTSVIDRTSLSYTNSRMTTPTDPLYLMESTLHCAVTMTEIYRHYS